MDFNRLLFWAKDKNAEAAFPDGAASVDLNLIRSKKIKLLLHQKNFSTACKVIITPQCVKINTS